MRENINTDLLLSLLFSSSLKADTNAIFITTNRLNDAKELLINGKSFEGIGVIFTSEIDGWKDSHWKTLF